MNEEHVGLVLEALSHRRGEINDMGPVPGSVGRTRVCLTCPSRHVPLSLSLSHIIFAPVYFDISFCFFLSNLDLVPCATSLLNFIICILYCFIEFFSCRNKHLCATFFMLCVFVQFVFKMMCWDNSFYFILLFLNIIYMIIGAWLAIEASSTVIHAALDLCTVHS